MSEGTQRRLAAIVAADVAGYSRLVGDDEEGTPKAGPPIYWRTFTPAKWCAIRPVLTLGLLDYDSNRSMEYRIGIVTVSEIADMSQELTTIFAAEMVRSNHSPADDRDATNDDLSACEGILTDCVQRHHGRTIEGSSGSGFLAGFSNAFDALSCAVEIQRDGVDKIETSSAAVPLRLSIGVNHEVLPNEGKIRSCNEDNDVARLVALAEPGGICISRTVYDEVRFKIKLPYMTERDPVHTSYS